MDAARLAVSAGAKEKLKLNGDVHGLPSLLQDRYNWIVAGKQVGAQWAQNNVRNGNALLRQLGDPSPLNAKDCPLCLWFGVHEPTQELLVLLTHSVQIGSRKSSPRRMFLLVPAESITFDFQALNIDQVPESLFERPSDTQSAYSNGFLHINFILGSQQRSAVIMPARRYEGRLRGTAFSLLDRFKSLSEARNLNLYLKFDSYALHKLQALQKSYHGRYRTPEFDVRGMYRGNRDGGFDLWQEQGWQNLESNVNPRKRTGSGEPATPPKYRRHDTASNSPPAYVDTAVLPSTPEVIRRVSSDKSAVVLVPQSCTPVSRQGGNVFTGSGVSRVFETPPFNVTTTIVPALDLPDSPLRARFFEEMPNWLLSAWQICPLVHYKCIVYLLQLGSRASTDNVDSYEKARAGCTMRFVSYRAKESKTVNLSQSRSTSTVGSTTVALSSLLLEDRNLINWMLIVDPLADTCQLFSPLIEFKKQLVSVLELVDRDSGSLRDNQTEDEFDKRYRQLIEIKARIVVEICFQFGGKALKSGGSLVRKIRDEVDILTAR